MKSSATAFHEALVILMIMLPWLNPFAPGPTPAVFPWLVAVGASAGLMLLQSLRSVSARPAGETFFAADWAFPVACACALAGLVSSVLGLLQYFGGSAVFEPWVNQTSKGEAFANLRQRNQFASLTSMALACVLYLKMNARFDRFGPWFALIAALILAAGNAASSSRTGLVQIIFLCGLSWFWGRGGRQRVAYDVLLTALLSYALLTLLLPWLGGLDLSAHGMAVRLRDGERTCGSRLTLWSNVLTLIAQKPWMGWGWGELDYAHYITLYPRERFCYILDNAHNLPLHLAVELGIPVALLGCSLTSCLVLRAKPWRETDPKRQFAWSVLTLIVLHSLLEYPLWYGPFQMAVGLCAVLLWPVRDVAVPVTRSCLTSPTVRMALASSILTMLAYTIWDYYRISQIYLAPQARSAAYREDTLNKIRGSWLFRDQVRFAELTTTPLSRDNAQWTFDTSTALLHYSPEPRVIEKVIESAVMLGRDDDALLHLARYRAAFPKDHEKWRDANRLADGRAF